MRPAFVYTLTLVSTGLIYIGSTYNVEKRIKRHMDALARGAHHNRILQQAWIGNGDILVCSFECANREDAYALEEKLIHKTLTGPFKNRLANIGENARAGNNLTRHPDKEEIIKRRTATQNAVLAKLSFKERREKYGRPGEMNGMFGRTHTEESRRLISEKHTGRHYGVGRKLSPEHVKKIRARAKLAIGEKNPFFGKKHSEETKRLLRIKQLGKKPTNSLTVSAEGLIFQSAADAGRHFKLSNSLASYRVRSKHFPNWFVINKTGNE